MNGSDEASERTNAFLTGGLVVGLIAAAIAIWSDGVGLWLSALLGAVAWLLLTAGAVGLVIAPTLDAIDSRLLHIDERLAKQAEEATG